MFHPPLKESVREPVASWVSLTTMLLYAAPPVGVWSVVFPPMMIAKPVAELVSSVMLAVHPTADHVRSDHEEDPPPPDALELIVIVDPDWRKNEFTDIC